MPLKRRGRALAERRRRRRGVWAAGLQAPKVAEWRTHSNRLKRHRESTSLGSVVFHLPTEYLEEHGPGHVRALALELAAELPFSFGYVSLAFLPPESFWYIEYDRVREFCFRYPGLDIYRAGEFSVRLGTLLRLLLS